MPGAKLFHVSPARNHASILKSGVEPVMSKGKTQSSWWVSQGKLAWAIAHCSARHQLPVTELEVWLRDGDTAKGMKRSRWTGVYYTGCRNVTQGHCTAEKALDFIARDELI